MKVSVKPVPAASTLMRTSPWRGSGIVGCSAGSRTSESDSKYVFDISGACESAGKQANTFRGFHSLAVDDAGGGTKLAPLPLAHLGNQGVTDQTPQSRSTPLVEVISNGRTRRKILWQRAPLTSRARDVEDRIYDDTQIGLAWPAT